MSVETTIKISESERALLLSALESYTYDLESDRARYQDPTDQASLAQAERIELKLIALRFDKGEA